MIDAMEKIPIQATRTKQEQKSSRLRPVDFSGSKSAAEAGIRAK
jgi:hypothetical protein